MSTKVPSLNRTYIIYTFKWPVARKHVHKCLCISPMYYYYYYHNKLAIAFVGFVACVAAIGRTTMVILKFA